MEKIVYYFDGITLLKYKLLSKTCNAIVENVVRYHKLWQKICLEEIPKKYFIDLINRKIHVPVSLDSLSEIECEQFYKNWLQWQYSSFRITCIGEHHFLGYNVIEKIICYNFDAIVVFQNCRYSLSLLKNEKKTDTYIIKVNEVLELNNMFSLLILIPQQKINNEDEEFNLNILNTKFKNCCPLHSTTTKKVIHGFPNGIYSGNLIDVDTNIHINTCCWVRETWYEWHSNKTNVVNGHKCYFGSPMFTSVVHGVIISRLNNYIIIHGIYNQLCIQNDSWLNRKYTIATAAYIYTNILFIGTQNSYLLAYRLHCWDDLINLKEKNKLFENKLEIGQIRKLNIIDFKNMKVIVVASRSSVLWLKIH